MTSLKQIPSEAQIIKFVRRIVFGKRLHCPICGSFQVRTYEDRYRCKKCRCRFSLTSHTWLKGMKLSWQEFWAVLDNYCKGLPVTQCADACSLSELTIRNWYARFRKYLPQTNSIMEGVVQMDEAYFKKTTLLMAKEVKTGRLEFQVILNRFPNKTDAVNFVQKTIKPGSSLHTDGSSIYKGIHQWWPVIHKVDIHKKFEFGLTSEIEGMFGVFRTFLRRMYHHIWTKHLEYYVCEFRSRFSTPEMFASPFSFLSKTLTLCTI